MIYLLTVPLNYLAGRLRYNYSGKGTTGHKLISPSSRHNTRDITNLKYPYHVHEMLIKYNDEEHC